MLSNKNIKNFWYSSIETIDECTHICKELAQLFDCLQWKLVSKCCDCYLILVQDLKETNVCNNRLRNIELQAIMWSRCDFKKMQNLVLLKTSICLIRGLVNKCVTFWISRLIIRLVTLLRSTSIYQLTSRKL